MFFPRDFVQKALKEGIIQFGEKPKTSMKMDSDPMQTEGAHYNEPVEILMVELLKASTWRLTKVNISLSLQMLTCNRYTPKLRRG